MDQGDLLNGVSIEELRTLALVNRTTAMRWKRGVTRCPAAVLKLVRLWIFGELAALAGAAWSDWRIGRDGLLYTSAWRRGFNPGEILAMPYLYARIAALERELRDALTRRRLDFHHAGRRCRASGRRA